MGRLSYAIGLLTGFINDTNFYVIYISFVIVFFLIGLLLGLNIHTRRKISKESKPADAVDTVGKSKQGYIAGQDPRMKTDNQFPPAHSPHHHSRHRHHKRTSVHIQ